MTDANFLVNTASWEIAKLYIDKNRRPPENRKASIKISPTQALVSCIGDTVSRLSAGGMAGGSETLFHSSIIGYHRGYATKRKARKE